MKKDLKQVVREAFDRSWAKDYKDSDFGRRYGWWVFLDGKKVTELNYRYWDSDGQFWHVYAFDSICPTSEALVSDVELWHTERVWLESRFATGKKIKGFLASEVRDGLISLRSVLVEKSDFREAYWRYHRRFFEQFPMEGEPVGIGDGSRRT